MYTSKSKSSILKKNIFNLKSDRFKKDLGQVFYNQIRFYYKIPKIKNKSTEQNSQLLLTCQTLRFLNSTSPQLCHGRFLLKFQVPYRIVLFDVNLKVLQFNTKIKEKGLTKCASLL